ncbi:hypothetical protein [Candidatus Nitrospira allomarina]|uniref:DUF306 domain-containing protein n=1 Tax=Candidatus Nitrospira allomarina TaxID=3020900 RepID=A0AA96G7Q2_9BACT|nr:hypothetical protein [Candidatus Nitrospira allomarina]WNM56678.1 hypothetical protein PP769_11890 [Candidatus Nitrospira allomarina]
MPFNKRTWSAIVLASLFLGSMGGMLLASTNPADSKGSAPNVSEPISTSALQIVNEEGKVRATLGLWDGDHPALIMGDDACGRRASLAVYGKERTGLTLYGEDCKRRAALEVQSDDLPMFVLRDHLDNPRVQVVLNKDGSPLVRLFDANGKSLWEKP